MYLAVSEHAVSVMLIRVQDGVQRPMYYVNKTLVDSEMGSFDVWYRSRNAIKG